MLTLVRLAFAAGLMAASATLLAAGSFSVSPVRVELRAGQSSASIEVVNNGSSRIQLTVERLAWTAGLQGERLDPTTEFVASPPLFDLAPGGRQVVRILLLRAPDPRRQLTYRIALQESPPQVAPEGVTSVLRVTLPVFVTPPRAAAALEWRRVDSPEGPELEVVNRGTATAQLAGVRVAGTRDLEGSGGYVLPGQVRRWRAPGLGGSIAVVLPSGDTQTVELSPPR